MICPSLSKELVLRKEWERRRTRSTGEGMGGRNRRYKASVAWGKGARVYACMYGIPGNGDQKWRCRCRKPQHPSTPRQTECRMLGFFLQRVSLFGFGPELHVSVQRATQSTGTVDYPRLGTRKLGVFRRCLAGSNALGCAGIQSGPMGIGPCRIPPSLCGAPLARCNVFAPPAALVSQTLPIPRRRSTSTWCNQHPHTPHLQFFPSSHKPPLHSGVLQTRWELMEGPKWSPPHGAKGPTSSQANGGSSTSCPRQNPQIGRVGPERCIHSLPCRDPASIRWALASEGCTHHQTDSQPQRNLPYCYHTDRNEQMICKGLPSSQPGALPNAASIPAAIKNP